MLLDRHRINKLIELAELEPRVSGPERLLREEDVALLVKAAYDDASDAARAEFMARVQPMPTSMWPWTAVQVRSLRAAGAPAAADRRIGGFVPRPAGVTPAALVLIQGEVESADVEPGNRLPNRGTPEAAVWEPLYKALDHWDTYTLRRWIGPQGWISPSGGAGQSNQGAGNGTSSGRPADGTGTLPGGSGDPSTAPLPASTFSWRSPAMIVAGTTAASTVGVVLYSLRRRRGPAGVTPQQEKP